ncbi:M48 family metalloprotease [Kitasatospora sp. RG8]|uniref:M48 family metalloprotease n=1 Tax=Kitasatospora sp. RG8 TaxID=2820815 RepID=UPI001AE092B4|nr:M48 family metalloprotease [Kitasatospora sp. RG8]MBP0450804.1 M48 family metalloprotease [Kitasatospora sp. RG8]
MLLIAVVAAAGAILLNGSSSVLLTAVDLRETLDYSECATRAAETAARLRAGDSTVTVPDYEFDCRDPRAATGRLIPLAATACLLLAVACVYVCLPKWRSRRRGYRPTAGMPELTAYLEDVVRGTDVRARVSFLFEPLDAGVSALAFGRVGQRRIVLSGGLVKLFADDRGAFRTVVLHELAHIRNRDVDVTFLTLIVWRMTGPPLLAMALISLTGAVTIDERPVVATILAFAVEVLVLAVLVTLLRNAVLRSRELHADARVVQWEGSAAPVRRLFAEFGLASVPATARRPAALRVHPSLAERDAALDDGRVLFPTGFWDMCAVGAAAEFLYEFLRLGPIGGGTRTGVVTDTVAAVAVATLLVGAAGTVLWQASGAAPGGVPPALVRKAGLGLGAGLGVSRLLAPAGVFNLATLDGRGAEIAVPYAVLLCLCGWGIARWLALVARTWMPVVLRHRRPRLVLLAVLGVSTVGLAPALDFLLGLPTMVLFAVSFIAPAVPALLVFVGSVLYLAAARMSTVLTPLVLTAGLVPLVGLRVAWRKGMAHTFPGFGPPLRTDGLLTRFGVPAGAAAACLGVLMPLSGVSLTGWDPVPVVCAAQVTAALLAGRGYAPLPLSRGLLAAYGAGVVALLLWFTVMDGLAGCDPGEAGCRAQLTARQVRLSLGLSSVGTAVAWAVHATLLALTRRAGHRANGHRTTGHR